MHFPSSFPRLFRPNVYQGRRKASRYFEGWYYKHVSEDGSQVWSFIFGVSYSEDPHCFVQVIEGKTGKTEYYRYPVNDFSFERRRLFISVGPNEITSESMSLNLTGKLFSIRGTLQYHDIIAFPQRWKAPGIMGWYTYVPFMECYHAVVSVNHKVEGALNINDEEIDFTKGKGYVEKDWGKSMPSDWVWIQCNHFPGEIDMSMMISVARIPWLNGFFPGFLSFVYHNGEIFQFATYNRSTIGRLEIREDYVYIEMKNSKAILRLKAERNISGELKAPVSGKMDRKIAESLDAEIFITLARQDGEVLFEGSGIHAGLEVVGDVSQYLD